MFYEYMYRTKTIKRKFKDGNTYILEYHRSPFWAYEKRSLKLFFKEKFDLWHGYVWLVYESGSRCGFGSCCFRSFFPKRRMRKFLISETDRLENIFNKEDTNET